jgi:hypothetical protein
MRRLSAFGRKSAFLMPDDSLSVYFRRIPIGPHGGFYSGTRAACRASHSANLDKKGFMNCKPYITFSRQRAERAMFEDCAVRNAVPGLFLLFGENELHDMHHASIAGCMPCITFYR